MSLKLIGVLGGAFDPIHCGHIELAKAWQDLASLSKVLFIPSGLAPHKNIVIDNKHRIEMLKLALNPHTNFFIDDREIKERRESPIFEEQLTSALKKEWAERLTQNVEDLRTSSHGLIMTKTFEYIDISSSEIRDTIYSNKNLINLLPAGVADYINLHKLYH